MADEFIHRAYDPTGMTYVRWTSDQYDPTGNDYVGPPAFGTLVDIVLERIILDPDPVVQGDDGRPQHVNSEEAITKKLFNTRYYLDSEMHVPGLDRPDQFELNNTVGNNPNNGYQVRYTIDGGSDMHVPGLDRPDQFELNSTGYTLVP